MSKKPYRRAITPSPPKGNSGTRSPSRPQTSLALYNEPETSIDAGSDYLRPKSAFGSSGRSPNVYRISRYIIKGGRAVQGVFRASQLFEAI